MIIVDFRTDGMEDQYSVLIRFDDQTYADAFFKHFNGKRFSSLEVYNLLKPSYIMSSSF